MKSPLNDSKRSHQRTCQKETGFPCDFKAGLLKTGSKTMDFSGVLCEPLQIMSPSARYLASAWLKSNYPPANRPEVAMAGRSNAGKSSFLNALFGQKLAKVSGTPGKTRSLNFFDYGPYYRWVDMPGYGFAARGRQEKAAWTEAIETYLRERENLRGLVLIMDIRRDWSSDEALMMQWCQHSEKPALVLLNKADKLSRSQALNRKGKIEKQSGSPALLVSSLKKTGVQEAEKYVFENWIQNLLIEETP